MNDIQMPKFLHEAFGEKQSLLELICTAIFALLGSWFIYTIADIPLDNWQAFVAMILIFDVLGGSIANFSAGTNAYYAKRSTHRLVFIGVHVHIVAIAWLLSVSMQNALIIWGYTIVSAFIVNALKGNRFQTFIAANLICYGIFLLIYLSPPTWFLIISIFFMIKVSFSFAVDHHNKAAQA